MSAVPDIGDTSWFPFGDKGAHVIAYAILGASLAWGRSRYDPPVGHFWVLALGIAYAATDEWHQMYVPGRQPDVADWLADGLGVLLGYGTTGWLLGRTKDSGPDPNEETRRNETS